MKLLAECLLGRAQLRVAACCGVLRENRRAGKAEEVVLLERLGNRLVHISELRAMTLVKSDDNVPLIDRVALILCDKRGELLDRSDNYPGIGIFQLSLQYCSRSVGVSRAFLEAVILTHRLIVEVLTVHNEKNLVYTLHL